MMEMNLPIIKVRLSMSLQCVTAVCHCVCGRVTGGIGLAGVSPLKLSEKFLVPEIPGPLCL